MKKIDYYNGADVVNSYYNLSYDGKMGYLVNDKGSVVFRFLIFSGGKMHEGIKVPHYWKVQEVQNENPAN